MISYYILCWKKDIDNVKRFMDVFDMVFEAR